MQNKPQSAPDNTQKVAGRLILGAVLIAVVVFGIEFVLSTMRSRTLTVTLVTELRFSPTPLPPEIPTRTPTRTPDPRKPDPTITPTPIIPFLAPGDAMIINAVWDYRIGPRFQRVTLRAGAYIADREQPVAEGTTIIDCGAEVFSCAGTATIPLSYQIPDAASPGGVRAIPWPAGEYILRVEQSAGGLKFTPVRESVFRVQPQ